MSVKIGEPTDPTFWPTFIIKRWTSSKPLNAVVKRALLFFIGTYFGATNLAGRVNVGSASTALSITSCSFTLFMVLQKFYRKTHRSRSQVILEYFQNNAIIGFKDFLPLIRKQAHELSYSEFISKHGLEVLNILDSASKEALRPKLIAHLTELLLQGAVSWETIPYQKLDISQQEIFVLQANCKARQFMQDRGDIRMFIERFDLHTADAITDPEARLYMSEVLPQGVVAKRVSYAELRPFFTLKDIDVHPWNDTIIALRELLKLSDDPQYDDDRCLLNVEPLKSHDPLQRSKPYVPTERSVYYLLSLLSSDLASQ